MLGVVIAEIGIFGLMAYIVAQRTREIGVRMALGAARSRVMAMVMSKAFTLVSAGVILGSASSWSTTANRFLFALEAHEPWAIHRTDRDAERCRSFGYGRSSRTSRRLRTYRQENRRAQIWVTTV